MDNNRTAGESSFLPSSSGCGSQISPDPASQGMQSQTCNEGNSLPTPLGYISQVDQQLPSQTMQNTVTPAGGQSASLPSRLLYGINRTDILAPNGVGQSSNSNMSHNSIGYSVGQCVPSNIFDDSQKMHGRQNAKLIVAQQQQQQQLSQNMHQSQNGQHYIYQAQLQNQIAKQKRYGQNQSSLIQAHVQHNQQQQQNVPQASQLQSYQQSFMQGSPCLQSNQSTLQQAQLSFMQSSPDSMNQQNQQFSVQKSRPLALQQHQHLLLRQHQQMQLSLHQKTPLVQQSMSSPHHNQHLLGKQPDETNIQQSQFLGESCNVLDLQQHQLIKQETQQCLADEQSNPSRVQQQQRQLIGGISNSQQEQLGGQCNMSGFHQFPMHMQHKAHQTTATMSGLSPQQLMSQLQIYPGQVQQQGLQKRTNSLQRDMHQRLYSSSPLLQPQNTIEQQKQLFQSQKLSPESSSTDATTLPRHTNGVDGHEEVLQKIKNLKDVYLNPLLNAAYCMNKILQTAKPELVEKFKKERTCLETWINFLNSAKHLASPDLKEKVLLYEKNIRYYLMRRNWRPSQGQQRLHPTGDHSPRNQLTQLQHDNQTNTMMMQPRNSIFSVTSVQPTAVASIQNDLMPSLSTHLGASTVQPSLELINGIGSSSLQQGAVGSPQKINGNATQDTRFNISHNDRTMLQPNIDFLQQNLSPLDHKHLKLQEQLIRAQKQPFQQHLMSHQSVNQQEQQMMQQQQHQQQKQQQSMQLFARQTQQPCQVSQSELMGKQGMNTKFVTLQQQTASQLSAFQNQQFKTGVPFHVSSPQSLQAASPQVSQHSSQTDPQNMIPSQSKSGTPLQSANSPLIAPSPSTPLTPSYIPGELEKQTSGVSSYSNAANSGQTQTVSAQQQAQSLIIGTPGIPASPLLAEFTSPEKDQGTASTIICGKSSLTDQPIDRLVNAVKSMSQKALSASVSELSSIVSMADTLQESAPVYGSRASVGEDLSATTKQNLLGKSFISKNGNGVANKMKRHRTLNFISSYHSVTDTFKHSNGLEISDLESTATSRIKRPRCEAIDALLDEIREINQQLINTMVNIDDEDINFTAAMANSQQGIVVKCCFTSLGLNLSQTSEDASTQKFPALAVHILIPTNYPHCSPILIDKTSPELSGDGEYLLEKARLRFSVSLRCLSQPMTLREMAKTWDAIAHAVLMEKAVQNGGGSFSSKYGTWENCISTN